MSEQISILARYLERYHDNFHGKYTSIPWNSLHIKAVSRPYPVDAARAIIGIGAASILLPGVSFIGIMFWSQVINGLLLPVVVLILLLVNDRHIMAEYVNGRIYNLVCRASVFVLTAIGIAYVISMFWVGWGVLSGQSCETTGETVINSPKAPQ